MFAEYMAGNASFQELHITNYGMEQCARLHDYGPAVRDHYLIHFILEGKGTFETGNRSYELQKGQAFLIFPGEITYYKADALEPWMYGWVGFRGTRAEEFLRQGGLSVSSPILGHVDARIVEHCIRQMHESRNMSSGRDLMLISLLCALFSHMAESNAGGGAEVRGSGKRHELYVQNVFDFIASNYANKISISQIADFVGLDRSYLCSVFKARTGSSIQEYLVRFRLNKACELMGNPLLSIGDIARSVGYEDPLLFSKMFKKEKGLSPKQYRSAHVQG